MSPRAAVRLEQLGFTDVYDYVLGKRGWLADGKFCDGEPPGAPLAGQFLSEVPTCRIDERVEAVRERLPGGGVCAVTDDTGTVLGRLDLDADGGDGAGGRLVAEAMQAGPPTIRASEPLEEIAHRMYHADVDDILVTDSAGQLLGLLERERAERALERADIGLHEGR